MSYSSLSREEYLAAWAQDVRAALQPSSGPAQTVAPTLASTSPVNLRFHSSHTTSSLVSRVSASVPSHQQVDHQPVGMDVQIGESSAHGTHGDVDETIQSDDIESGHMEDEDAHSVDSDLPMSICPPIEDGRLNDDRDDASSEATYRGEDRTRSVLEMDDAERPGPHIRSHSRKSETAMSISHIDDINQEEVATEPDHVHRNCPSVRLGVDVSRFESTATLCTIPLNFPITTPISAVGIEFDDLDPPKVDEREDSVPLLSLSAHNNTEKQGAATRLSLPLGGTTAQTIPTPCLEVEEDDEGYIYERPNHTRRRAESDDEHKERDERPTKRTRFQDSENEEMVSQLPNPDRVHIKRSCGRRTQGVVRRR
ncbi:6342_t:CDS:2 [Acaulospora colombiana]|uniref:6342_t:CDS:1 n=1 Tax=Acaulospora colombiana TaxID=27376 RepID=A0ACA9PF19_9GLOM|nr:6342_t:CDS:2 [Acaulospora colombiana]